MSTPVRITPQAQPVNLLEIAARRNTPQAPETEKKTSFREMFSRELAGERGVRFSQHASQRLYSRGIRLSDELLNRVADAIDKAEQKGSRETLILTDNAALVVAVKNRTVVTAFDREKLREGIVTSIDSAVIL